MEQLPCLVTRVPGPRSQALARRLERVESPDVTYLPEDGSWPVFWESGEGLAILDADGNRLLDATAAFGVAILGHAHPQLAAALADQAARLPHGMGDVHPTRLKVELAERLAALAPLPEPSRVLLATTGAEAVEGALKTACLATGRPRVIACEGGYHGLSLGTLPVTGREGFRAPFRDLLPVPSRVCRVPYTREGIAALTDADLASVGAILVEPILGRGGVVVPPPGLLQDLRALADRLGAVLILDEVFTGCGRTGTWFACQHEGIEPDLLVLGKALSGCFPIAAVIGRGSVMEAWPRSTGEALHTSTHLGNPLGCRAALTALDLIEEGDLVTRAAELGAVLGAGLTDLADAHPGAVLQARGRGLMQALVLREAGAGARLAERALALGLLTLPAGAAGEVLQLTPPLILEEEHVHTMLELLDRALASLP
jgi:4-aminobutyrate aminotransferase/(S)-3-amino-2-methylpropionate transaminase